MVAWGLAFVAGLLSTLSPCVLPILPLVLGAAASEQRLGPVALAAGLALSFVTIGLFVATIGFSLGLDSDSFRMIAAIAMVAAGVLLTLPSLQTRLALAGGPVADWSARHFGGLKTSGLLGQFGTGLLLGAVWIPCVGPTLGAASILAAQGRDLPQVALTMLAFGVGASIPLILLGLISREVWMHVRPRLLETTGVAQIALGIVLTAIGLMIVSGFDKTLEAGLVESSPQWLIDLTTRL
jgi:cytochrome c biogenesis protein CcdA